MDKAPNVSDVIPLPATHREYVTVSSKFQTTMSSSRYNIKYIYKVQNRSLWDRFARYSTFYIV
jgi:hypothetical protein